VIDLLGVRVALIVLGIVAPTLATFAWPRLRAIDTGIAHRDAEIEVLNDVPIFRPLPMPAIDELALHLDQLEIPAGADLVVEGEHGDRFYVIQAGEADVIGDGRVIRVLHSGDGFGEIALLHDTLRTATVRARTPIRLYTLDRHHFLSAISGYESSEREAQALALDRLEDFNPAH
jgi:CRP-like cAMP-binding protein